MKRRPVIPRTRHAGTYEERVQYARYLRSRGFTIQQIADELEVPRSTASRMCDPHALEKQRIRFASYGAPCVDCGKTTSGSNGVGKAPLRCLACANANRRRTKKWTREAIVAAIREFHAKNGRTPAATDFQPSLARAKCSPERFAEAVRANATGVYPPATTVQNQMGSWNAGLRAAGLALNSSGGPTHMAHTGHTDRVGSLLDREIERIDGRLAELRQRIDDLQEERDQLAAAKQVIAQTTNGSTST